MRFKEPHLRDEFKELHPAVQQMAIHFEQLSIHHLNKDPIVTRILDVFPGATGVHPDKRAIDFRNEHAGKFMYTPGESRFLVSEMNRRFPGKDAKPTCIMHSFNGGPHHFHIQISSGDDLDEGSGCNYVV